MGAQIVFRAVGTAPQQGMQYGPYEPITRNTSIASVTARMALEIWGERNRKDRAARQ